MFNQIQVRLTLLTVGIFLALYMIPSFSIYGILRQVVLRTIDVQLSGIVRQLEHQKPLAVVKSLPDGTYAMVVKPGEFVSNATPDLAVKLQTLIQRHKYQHFTVNLNQQSAVYRVIYVPLTKVVQQNQVGYIVTATNVAREMAVLHRLKSVLLLVGVLGTLIAIMAGFFLAGRAMRPIRKAWQRQIQFVADASHELRTPLAVIQSNLGIVLDHSDQTVLDNLEWINNAHSEARRLAKLVEDLLTLARSDSQTAGVQLQPVDLTKLVPHVVELFETVAIVKRLELESDLSGEIHIMGDRDRLQQLFVILLDNACKYTSEGGKVRVTVALDKNTAVVQIEDTGQGIADADLNRVFERFFRADEARHRGETGGAGLGLAIAKWIVEAHQGKIMLKSKLGEGTRVTVKLPVRSAESAQRPSLMTMI